MPELIEDDEVESLTLVEVEKPVVRAPRHYIDDEHLTGILSEWKKVFDADIAAGKERPKLPEAVGEAIFDMAEALGKRHNFSGYSYLDEMKSDAILHCVKYIHNFNPEKKSQKKGKVSAFGYINMIIWRSFTHRIDAEKREQYLKYKSFELMGGMDAFQDEDLESASGGSDGDEGGLSVGVLGSDFITKAREYEEKNGLDSFRKPKEKKVAFDGFMFDIGSSTEEVPEEVDLDQDVEIEFE
jgi:hypothetical protein